MDNQEIEIITNSFTKYHNVDIIKFQSNFFSKYYCRTVAYSQSFRQPRSRNELIKFIDQEYKKFVLVLLKHLITDRDINKDNMIILDNHIEFIINKQINITV